MDETKHKKVVTSNYIKATASCMHQCVVKSDNLQYNTLVRWFAGTNDSSSKYFFHNFLQNSLQKLFQLIFLFFHKFTKIKSFECPKSIGNYKKNNAWDIRCLVDESFVPANQRTSVLCCRLSDLWAN